MRKERDIVRKIVQSKDLRSTRLPGLSSTVKLVRNFTAALCGFFGVKRLGEVRTVKYGYLQEFPLGIMWNLVFSKTD